MSEYTERIAMGTEYTYSNEPSIPRRPDGIFTIEDVPNTPALIFNANIDVTRNTGYSEVYSDARVLIGHAYEDKKGGYWRFMDGQNVKTVVDGIENNMRSQGNSDGFIDIVLACRNPETGPSFRIGRQHEGHRPTSNTKHKIAYSHNSLIITTIKRNPGTGLITISFDEREGDLWRFTGIEGVLEKIKSRSERLDKIRESMRRTTN